MKTWEQRKLSDIAVLTSSKRVHAEDYVETGVPFYRGKEISELKEHKPISEVLYITEYKYNEISSMYGSPKKGDLLITAVGTLGNTWVIDQTPFYFKDGNLIWFKDIKCNPKYLDYAMSTADGQKKILASAIGSNQKALTMVKLNELEFMFPGKAEQDKIAEYFSYLDNLITLHQRKCEETKSLKKYMLQKMFPENGNCVPKIRFSGFSDAWEQRKFSEFVENVAVRNREGLELECYAVTNDRGFISQKDAHDDFGYMADVDTTAYNIVPPNSFAYNPARINVGSIGYYAGTENVIVSSLYEVFQTANYVDDRFLWHWFKSEHFPKWIERLQEGSVRLYFYYDKLIQCEIKMPSLEEQMKLGAYFDHLNHLITLHQHKCDELQKLKKFMLQNMFV